MEKVFAGVGLRAKFRSDNGFYLDDVRFGRWYVMHWRNSPCRVILVASPNRCDSDNLTHVRMKATKV